MSAIVKEVYDAFREAGVSEEKSAEAAAVADFDTCFANLEADRLVLKWMVGLVIAAEVLPLLLLEGVARLYGRYEA